MKGVEEAVRKLIENRVFRIGLRNYGEVREKATGVIGNLNSSGNGSEGGKEAGVDVIVGTYFATEELGIIFRLNSYVICEQFIRRPCIPRLCRAVDFCHSGLREPVRGVRRRYPDYSETLHIYIRMLTLERRKGKVGS